MGTKASLRKENMSNPAYFADAFNSYLFDGKQVLKQESLVEKDPTEIAVIFKEGEQESAQKVRDVLKECCLFEDDRASYLMLGIENQSNVHYAMVVKNLIYDALNLGKQVTTLASQHKGNKDLSGDEFLSGFSKIINSSKLIYCFWITTYTSCIYMMVFF